MVTDVLPQVTSYLTTAFSQVICICTAVNEEVGSPMGIVPNPAHDLVRVSGSAIEQVDIVDATGHVLLSRAFRSGSSVDLDIRSLTIGLYYLRIKTDDGRISDKLIKE